MGGQEIPPTGGGRPHYYWYKVQVNDTCTYQGNVDEGENLVGLMLLWNCSETEETMKKCPFCTVEIQDEAIVCSYCGRDLYKSDEENYVENKEYVLANAPKQKLLSGKCVLWTFGTRFRR